MARHSYSAERTIPAPAASVYALLTDYRVGHPSILPPALSDFTVLEGGSGAGTRMRFTLTLAGRSRTMEALVSEPEPGRVIAETYTDGSVTAFVIDPIDESESRLRIESRWPARGGLTGFIERIAAPWLLRPLYRDELDLIESWAHSIHPRSTESRNR